MLEPEEKLGEQQQQRLRKAKARAATKATWRSSSANRITKSNSAILFTAEETTATEGANSSQLGHRSSSQLQGSVSSCLNKSSVKVSMDRRCDSVGDRGTTRGTGVMGTLMMANSMPTKPKPEPIEINIDLERIEPPVENAAASAAAAAHGAMV